MRTVSKTVNPGSNPGSPASIRKMPGVVCQVVGALSF